ncbi:hypothetical protein CC78DRAFT_341513 [Lojkania enalia]|uniref:Asl1-like glycosyl hydrolase catalytic domain-containing protein n=1 Tax=Lojkania enalia TaxID=147567 RepID=A0A9P4K2M8_9PLEO|nr:hypothetical protein CC78DRAFT_341513 [Didymosphaeria enalia]
MSLARDLAFTSLSYHIAAMASPNPRSHSPLPLISPRNLLQLAFFSILHSISSAQQNEKRGIAYLGDTHDSDNSLLLSPSSPLSWYYNWSPYPNVRQIPADAIEFVPLIHGIDQASDSRTASQLNNLPQTSHHLLAFNEPDGLEDSGGSAVSPEDAARAYIDYIAPYRNGGNGGREWYISHPVTTGSPRGLDWLRDFNQSCYEIDEENGCPIDFITAHWYGTFTGLAGWLGSLNEFYNMNSSRDPPLRIWITEMALPQQDADATVRMMNQTLPYLDNLDYVDKYAWFGAFRTDDANEWTGDGVALFDDDGGLTELGALYMGGEENGFEEGQKGEGSALSGASTNIALLLSMSVAYVAMIGFW